MRALLTILLCIGLFAGQSGLALAKTKSKPVDASPAATVAASDLPLSAGAHFFAPAGESSSAAVAYHSGTGLHAAYAGYGGADGNSMFYAQCVKADCNAADAWQSVQLPLRQAVKVQLALTPSGQPRLFGAGWSPDDANGTNYVYAECDRDCLNARNWRIGTVMSTSDGLMSNISRTRLSERNFALDEKGNPRFVVADSNYRIEPDHYGAFYMACDSDCTNAASWSETNLANAFGYNTESFHHPVLALAPGGKARMIANVYAFDEAGTDLEDGLYYYECDRACTTRSNWARTLVIEAGYGSYPDPSWDLKALPDGRPRLGFFAGNDMKDAGLSHQLIYAWCDADCTSEADTWSGYKVGVGDGNGESPSLALDAEGIPHMAFVTSGHELGYAYCVKDCQSSNTAEWNADFAERSDTAASDRPTALPFTCDGELSTLR